MTDQCERIPPEDLAELKRVVTEAVRKCARHGIHLRDFYHALLEVQELFPGASAGGQMDLTFERMGYGED